MILTVAAYPAVFAAEQDDNARRMREDRAFAGMARVDPALVVAWNQIITNIAYEEDQFFTFKGHRALAMAHIAMHDAINAVMPVYRQYGLHRHDSSADWIAAAAQAARDVVVSQYPGQQARVEAELAKWLSLVPEGPHKRRGVALGQHSAAAILALRAGDGWDDQGTYTFSNEIGAYQATPPWNFVLQPGFRYAKPFGLRAPNQFRPAPPPPLNGPEYASAFNEVKDVGRVNSTVRTVEETLYAIWWMEFAEGSVNRLARRLATERKMHLLQASRLFALINMSLFDAYLANWDSKYEHNHWRPYTAIRAAALDGNALTQPDSNWEPLRVTPPFPDYVSAHATGTGAAMDILRRTFGDSVSFTMETITAPQEMPTRTFGSFSAAAAECADSRVRLGWHFRYSANAGLTLGRTVAGWIADNYLQFRGAPR
jgi:hypothetical protein